MFCFVCRFLVYRMLPVFLECPPSVTLSVTLLQRLFNSSLLLFVLYGVIFYLMLFVFIYAYWCSGRCPYHMMSLSFNSHMTGTTSRAERFTLEEHLNSSLFCGSRLAQFYVLFCGTQCVFMSFFILAIVFSVLRLMASLI